MSTTRYPRAFALQILVVEGRGRFPLEMADRDLCAPASESDALRMHDDGPRTGAAGKLCVRRIALRRFFMPGDTTPHLARWESFGWRVVWYGPAEEYAQGPRALQLVDKASRIADGPQQPARTDAPAATPLTFDDAVAIGDALARWLGDDSGTFAGALEVVIRRQAAPHARYTSDRDTSANEARHGHLCGWIAAQLSVTAAAEARAARYLDEMAANPCGVPTPAEARVVGLDSVVNKALGHAGGLERLAMVGALLTAAAKEAASCTPPTPAAPPST